MTCNLYVHRHPQAFEILSKVLTGFTPIPSIFPVLLFPTEDRFRPAGL